MSKIIHPHPPTAEMPDNAAAHDARGVGPARRSSQRQEHGEAGHCNIYTRDHDSIITHYGQHDRVVASLPGSDGLLCRVDHKWGLGMPSVDQILDVARKDQGVKGKWKLRAQITYDNDTRTQFEFDRT